MPRHWFRTVECLTLALALGQSLPLCSQSTARVALTAADVSVALTEANLRVSEGQIQVPGSLSTTDKDRQLRISGAELLPEARLRIRLACGITGACPPFMAIVQRASVAEAMSDLSMLQKDLQSTRSTRDLATAGHVLAGQHATLLLEDSHMRIQLPVLVVDSGAAGAEVRVSSLDRKQLYRAVVADAGTVRGNLP